MDKQKLKIKLAEMTKIISDYERASGNSFSDFSLYPEFVQEALESRSLIAAQLRAA